MPWAMAYSIVVEPNRRGTLADREGGMGRKEGHAPHQSAGHTPSLTAHLEENMAAADLILSDGDLAALDTLA